MQRLDLSYIPIAIMAFRTNRIKRVGVLSERSENLIDYHQRSLIRFPLVPWHFREKNRESEKLFKKCENCVNQTERNRVLERR